MVVTRDARSTAVGARATRRARVEEDLAEDALAIRKAGPVAEVRLRLFLGCAASGTESEGSLTFVFIAESE
jgi:hypothetical protein